MTQERLVHHDTLVPGAPPELELETRSEGEEILRVLDKAAEDNEFIAQLTHRGADALKGYQLIMEAQAALLSGDVRWIEEHVGKLDDRLRTWLDCRLQQEIW